jgi:hypothetical protein
MDSKSRPFISLQLFLSGVVTGGVIGGGAIFFYMSKVATEVVYLTIGLVFGFLILLFFLAYSALQAKFITNVQKSDNYKFDESYRTNGHYPAPPAMPMLEDRTIKSELNKPAITIHSART